MKMVTRQAYDEIRTWVYRNARHLEIALWQYHFEKSSADAVVSALAEYQNPDGGFGNALEPDSWNPSSSPYTTSFAIGLLRTVGYTDMDTKMWRGILAFLSDPAYRITDGWMFSIPTNDGYARAPWWTYSAEANRTESVGLTAMLGGTILRYGKPNTDLYRDALEYANRLFERLMAESEFGDMGLDGFLSLIADIKAAKLEDKFDIKALEARVLLLAGNKIERDSSKWAQYTTTPLALIHSPESPLYPAFESSVAEELDFMVDMRPEGTVWPITWTWFDMLPQYAREFAISENWWKAIHGIDKLVRLRDFGRLEA